MVDRIVKCGDYYAIPITIGLRNFYLDELIKYDIDKIVIRNIPIADSTDIHYLYMQKSKDEENYFLLTIYNKNKDSQLTSNKSKQECMRLFGLYHHLGIYFLRYERMLLKK